MWRKIKLAKPDAPKDAFVTIGNGQIHFGIGACKMMPECLEMTHVEFFRCEDENLIGVHVTNEETEDSIPMQRPASQAIKKKKNHVQSFNVLSKRAMEKVFGEAGINPDSIKCKVTVDEDSHDMFIIDMTTARPAKRKDEDV